MKEGPTADPNGPYTGTVGIAVSFDGTGSSDPESGVLTYAWDFGDGSSGTGVSPSHTYASDDTFTVTLTVTDDDDASSDAATTTATIEASNVAPTADPNGPYSGTVGRVVSFDGNESRDPHGTIASYARALGETLTVRRPPSSTSHARSDT